MRAGLLGWLATMADDLRSIGNQSTVKLTTIGRRSGQPLTVTIWFVPEGYWIYVQAGKGRKAQRRPIAPLLI